MNENHGNSRLPVKRAAAPPPALWQQAAPVVARSAALIAAGLIGEWLLRAATRRALRLPLEPRKTARSKAVALRQNDRLPEGAIAISETIVMRRVIFRR
jgi:hypothetical protein